MGVRAMPAKAFVPADALGPGRLPGLTGPRWTACVAVVAVLIGSRLPPTGLLMLAVTAGLPHGAFDYDVARAVFARRAGRWRLRFLAGYLGLAAATLLLWCAAPAVALCGFFLLSALHFGRQDSQGSPGWLRVLAHGGAPIVLPAVFHPAVFRRLVAVTVGHDAVAIQHALAGPLAWLWFAAAAVTLARYAASIRPADRDRGLDLLFVGAIFVIATPLAAFSFYFALIHTPRAIADTDGRLLHSGAALARAASLTVLALALAGVLYLALPSDGVADGIVRSGFVLLSALTVPHMRLEHLRNRAAERTALSRASDPDLSRRRSFLRTERWAKAAGIDAPRLPSSVDRRGPVRRRAASLPL